MGRIFLSAGHGGVENGIIDSGTVITGSTEAREMILLRDLLQAELRSRNLEVLSVPDDQSFTQTLTWINQRGRNDDVSLELHALDVVVAMRSRKLGVGRAVARAALQAAVPF